MKEHGRLKFISILPSAITLLNGFLGFLAILLACRDPSGSYHFPLFPRLTSSYTVASAWMIVFGMMADAVDGSVARASGNTSGFGAQLDSLCDSVSFGIAPAFLSYKLLTEKIIELRQEEFHLTEVLNRTVLFAVIFYAMCALLRLARFNVETDDDKASHMNFAGLPSPAAAGLIISTILFREKFMSSFLLKMDLPAYFVTGAFENATLWFIPFSLFFTGILMVSRISYPHLINQLMYNRKPFSILILAIIFGLLAILNIHIVLFLSFLSFCIYGVVNKAVEMLRNKRLRIQ